MKTKILLVFCILALAVAGFFGVQEWRARSWEARWDEFLARWQAEGEIFDPAKLTPPDSGQDSDFAGHPLIRRIAAGEAGVLQTLEKMKPDQVEGFEDWESDTDDDGVHHPMSPELARKVLDHAAAFSAELGAFAEAAQRPHCRFVANERSITGDMAWNTSAAKLSSIGKLLGASAHAAAAVGDGPSLTRHIETLCRAGNLLRSSDLSLGVVVGTGFESQAIGVIRSIPDPSQWPESDRRRWLAALDLRTRPLADEFAATSRMERNLFLRQMDALAAAPSVPLTGGLAGRGPFRRIFLARAKLAACEALQGMVLSDGGRLAKTIEPARIARFQDHLKNPDHAPHSSKSRLDPAEKFGLLPLLGNVGIQDALIQFETDRAAARERIRSSLR